MTLTGRSIVRHMNSKINEIITGVYQVDGAACRYADTDSILNNSILYFTSGTKSIEDAFLTAKTFWKVGDKEYAGNPDDKVLTYDPNTDKAIYKPFNYIYRHKVSKAKWKITDEDGNEVIVTEDHSCMVERDGDLIEVKPKDILPEDTLISVKID